MWTKSEPWPFKLPTYEPILDSSGKDQRICAGEEEDEKADSAEVDNIVWLAEANTQINHRVWNYRIRIFEKLEFQKN